MGKLSKKRAKSEVCFENAKLLEIYSDNNLEVISGFYDIFYLYACRIDSRKSLIFEKIAFEK